MKKLAMLLGCGMVAFAIGCGDSGSGGGTAVTPPVMPDTSKMTEMMNKNKPADGTPAGDAAAGGEKKEGDAPAEKKEGDAPAEKKEGDSSAEKKEGDAPAEKKE